MRRPPPQRHHPLRHARYEVLVGGAAAPVAVEPCENRGRTLRVEDRRRGVGLKCLVRRRRPNSLGNRVQVRYDAGDVVEFAAHIANPLREMVDQSALFIFRTPGT